MSNNRIQAVDSQAAQPNISALFLISSLSLEVMNFLTAILIIEDLSNSFLFAHSLVGIPTLSNSVNSTAFRGWSECIGQAAMRTPMLMLSVQDTQRNFISLCSNPRASSVLCWSALEVVVRKEMYKTEFGACLSNYSKHLCVADRGRCCNCSALLCLMAQLPIAAYFHQPVLSKRSRGEAPFKVMEAQFVFQLQ
ncbi:hypothetical protein PanWU01x14_199120 [Parasponia andersonii]|uniref:Uncharacterized protein n=1 Tax=Parasponia andersonii TaxID=3476 RepID=A0A2P5BYT6_PARAD|nr:hypothetical protein PanWU01x14_199120 [Parasponia andersonii]